MALDFFKGIVLFETRQTDLTTLLLGCQWLSRSSVVGKEKIFISVLSIRNRKSLCYF